MTRRRPLSCTVPDRARQPVPVRHRYCSEKDSRRSLPSRAAGRHGKRPAIRSSRSEMTYDICLFNLGSVPDSAALISGIAIPVDPPGTAPSSPTIAHYLFRKALLIAFSTPSMGRCLGWTPCPRTRQRHLVPKKKGRPQSKFPGNVPPISTNTLMKEFAVRSDQIADLEGNHTARCAGGAGIRRRKAHRGWGAEPDRIREGQGGNLACGRRGEEKPVRTAVDETAVGAAAELRRKFARRRTGGIGRHREEGTLLDWVPIPRMRVPSTEGVPPRGTLGSCTITPLLSRGRSAAGFWTWLERGTVVPLQFVPLQA